MVNFPFVLRQQVFMRRRGASAKTSYFNAWVCLKVSTCWLVISLFRRFSDCYLFHTHFVWLSSIHYTFTGTQYVPCFGLNFKGFIAHDSWWKIHGFNMFFVWSVVGWYHERKWRNTLKTFNVHGISLSEVHRYIIMIYYIYIYIYDNFYIYVYTSNKNMCVWTLKKTSPLVVFIF